MKPNITKIAKDLSLSRSTVSRALSGSCGVSPEKRKLIFDYIKNQKLEIPSLNKESSRIVIAAGIPSRQAFFWSQAIDGIKRAVNEAGGDVLLKLIRFGEGRTEEETLHVINMLTSCRADGYIIVPVQGEIVQGELKRLSADAPVAVINERINFDGRFLFAGPDDYNLGKEAANVMIADNKGKLKAVIIKPLRDFSSINDRIKGFKEVFLKHDDCLVTKIIEAPISGQQSPSKIARELSSIDFDSYNCIYVADGILDYVATALSKLGRHDRVYCLCHDVPLANPQNNYSGLRGAYINQDIDYQGYIAAKKLILHLKGIEPCNNSHIISPYIIRRF